MSREWSLQPISSPVKSGGQRILYVLESHRHLNPGLQFAVVLFLAMQLLKAYQISLVFDSRQIWPTTTPWVFFRKTCRFGLCPHLLSPAPLTQAQASVEELTPSHLHCASALRSPGPLKSPGREGRPRPCVLCGACLSRALILVFHHLFFYHG